MGFCSWPLGESRRYKSPDRSCLGARAALFLSLYLVDKNAARDVSREKYKMIFADMDSVKTTDGNELRETVDSKGLNQGDHFEQC